MAATLIGYAGVDPGYDTDRKIVDLLSAGVLRDDLAQMERDAKLERARHSMAKRRADGRSLGGRKRKFTDRQIDRVRRALATGKSATDIGTSRATLYRRLRLTA